MLTNLLYEGGAARKMEHIEMFDIRNFKCNIQEAVDACAKNGGGTVLIPAGIWKSGKIHLKSHVLSLIHI